MGPKPDSTTEQPTQPQSPHDTPPESFADEADREPIGLAREFVEFLRDNKKWWLTPLILSLLFLGLIMVLAAGGAAPFIYTLF